MKKKNKKTLGLRYFIVKLCTKRGNPNRLDNQASSKKSAIGKKVNCRFFLNLYSYAKV